MALSLSPLQRVAPAVEPLTCGRHVAYWRAGCSDCRVARVATVRRLNSRPAGAAEAFTAVNRAPIGVSAA